MISCGRVAIIFVCSLFSVSCALAADSGSISAKSDDGVYIGLDDGTKWIIAASDRSTVAGWSIGDDVVYTGTSRCSGTVIINTQSDGEEACAIDVGGNTESITETSDSGSYLALDDGSRFIVSSVDRSTTATWLETDDVIYLRTKTCSGVEIINLDEDADEVCATSVGR
ncbi:MAG: hypothetical protein WBW84_19445 [Acidobacteriaceae bacterium]